MSFVTPSDPILREASAEVAADSIASDEVQYIIEHMYNIAYGNREDRSKSILVGLAAPQIGISQRIILVDIAADGKGHVADLKAYINPQITWESEEADTWYEGCYSTSRVCGIVTRPKEIEVTAYKRDGKLVTERHQGYVARIFQHEIDHLNGMVFVDRIPNDDDLHWVEDNEMGQYRNEEKWRTWECKCSREKWEKIKNGEPLDE